MTEPTIAELTAACSGRYIRLARRPIGSRYLIAHWNVHVFVLGVGVETCKFGLIWYIGPLSFCFAKPGETHS